MTRGEGGRFRFRVMVAKSTTAVERDKNHQLNSRVTSAATVSPDTPNVLQAIMKLDQVKTRTKTTNKVALESEKKRDDSEKIVEQYSTSS